MVLVVQDASSPHDAKDTAKTALEMEVEATPANSARAQHERSGLSPSRSISNTGQRRRRDRVSTGGV